MSSNAWESIVLKKFIVVVETDFVLSKFLESPCMSATFSYTTVINNMSLINR